MRMLPAGQMEISHKLQQLMKMILIEMELMNLLFTPLTKNTRADPKAVTNQGKIVIIIRKDLGIKNMPFVIANTGEPIEGIPIGEPETIDEPVRGPSCEEGSHGA